MSITQLLFVVNMLCSAGQTPLDRYYCKEEYVNCSVKLNGLILSRTEFAEACVDKETLRKYRNYLIPELL